MMSFNNNNDSMSFIKGYIIFKIYSPDETHNIINIKNNKKLEKMTILPEIKMNIVMSNENQKFKNNDSDDSDNEIHVKFLKLIP
jgi:hypothetical protein